MKLAIVITAYNEEKTIAEVVHSVKKFGTAIVVNDGSTDKTSELAKSAGAVVIDKVNGGYDSALEEGFKQAALQSMSHVITFDGDGQHPAAAIPQFIQKFEEGFFLVVGERPRKQRFAEFLFSIYTRLFFHINDPLCGMKGYELSLYKKIGHFDSYSSTGTELMLHYLKSNKKSVQIKIPIKDRIDAPRFGSVMSSNLYILKSLIKGITSV